VLENGAAARRLLEAVQKVDAVDDNVKVVDAAIAERTKHRGRVKVHQTEDMGAMKGGFHGAAIGVVVGALIAGPAGAVAGAAGGLLHVAEAAAPVAAAAAAATAAGDDLTQLVDIGPKAATALAAAGISTYAALAEANEPQLRRALHEADMMPPGNVGTWPMQASYAAKGDWMGLMKHNEKATTKAKPAPASTATAAAAPPDDLTQINGIGPRIQSILNDGGITTFDQLQHANTGDLRQIIAVGGALPPSSLDSWPTQATYAARGDWQGLATYNRR
jgi:predicted flap endonuclease-1-like 5' DNA nuclease